MDADVKDIQEEIAKRREQFNQNIQEPAVGVKLTNLSAATKFSEIVDEAKINVIKEASTNDDKFVADFKDKLKEATLKAAELEKQKQELENKFIELQQNYIKTKNENEHYIQQKNNWENKERARKYHYDGLKDIMEFLRIKNPMWIPLMYFLAIAVSPIYLVWVLVLSPAWTIISGKEDSNRPKAIRATIWGLVLLFMVILIVFFIYAIGRFKFGWFC